MIIYTYPENPRVYKALIAAKYVGVEIQVPAFEMGTDNKTPEFLKKNPLGKVPVLETDDGNTVFESNAIARYVARLNPSANLFGKSVYEAALVDQWVDFTVGEIDLPANAWLLPISGYIPNNPQATAKAVQDIRKVFTILNNHLAARTFLVGERVSLADIVVVCSVFKLYQMVLDASFRKPFANVNRWFLTCVHQPQFKAVLGDVHLCEKVAQAGDEAPKAAKKEQQQQQQQQQQPKKEQPKKEEKKEQPKKEQPKKEEKKEEKEEEEEDYEEKPKAKNPLDLLPKSTFDIEEWKRTYSNKDTRKEAIPWLWSNFDAEGFSIWFADYKYNDELASVLYACNLAGGFIQRLDRLRKYGFATLVIFGTSNPDIVLSGVFIVRGKEIPFELSDAPDYESYTFKKVDINEPAQKTLVENYLAWDGEFPHGKAVNQGKVFK